MLDKLSTALLLGLEQVQELSQVLLIGVLDLRDILTDLGELVKDLHIWDFETKM